MSQPRRSKSKQEVNTKGSSLKGQMGQAIRDLWQFQFIFDEERALAQQAHQNRKALISKVRNFWIKGVLERSLYEQVIIELDLERRLDFIEQPFDLISIVFADRQVQSLPKGAKVIDIFHELGEGGTLLILGEPGAGKTISLLNLARDLLQHIDNEKQEIPVVFNLSSWKDRNQTIASWLVQELWEKYQVPKSVGKTLIKQEKLVILLDGLDETHVDLRSSCVLSLNRFFQVHGKTSAVVCSRINDYQMLSQHLKFQYAISIKPLTFEQVDKYLDGAGENLRTIRMAVQTDSILKELIRSPLLLSVMSLAYSGISTKELPVTDSKVEYLNHLFNTYIERMLFRRQSSKKNYIDENLKQWLGFLSTQMVKNSQTIFFIEKMQPSWLSSWIEKAFYYTVDGLIVGSFLGVHLGLLTGVASGLNAKGLSISVYEEIFILSIVGLILGSILGIIGGLIIGLILGLLRKNIGEIKTAATLKWSWKTAKVNLMFGLIGGLFLSILGLVETKNIDWLFVGLGTGLFMGFIFSLISGVESSEIESTYSPNEGIRKSILNAGIYTLIYGLVLGLSGVVISLLISGNSYTFEGGLLGALLGGIIGGLINSKTCIRHLALRLVLFFSGHIPWNYARFLNYATERVFLQKVGGSYIFIHRLLLEHFSSLPKSDNITKG